MESDLPSVVSPEELLTLPEQSSEDQQAAQSSSPWLLVARNRRVNRSWEKLILKAPENTQRCYKHLCNSPTTRIPGRVFPLRGNLYKGAWEYEVTGGDRVFYIPDSENRKVEVYYAGPHIKPAPSP